MPLLAGATTRLRAASAFTALAVSTALVGTVMPAAGTSVNGVSSPANHSTVLAATSSSSTVRPVADAYVSSATPSANYGSSKSLRVDTSPIVRSYLRFDLRAVSGTVTSARLTLFAATASTAGYSVATSGDAWTESGITWSNAPAPGPAFASSAPFASGSAVSVDVTAAVHTGTAVDLVVIGRNSTAMRFDSREGTNPPSLALTISEPAATATASLGPVPTSPPTLSPTPVPQPTPMPTPQPTSTPASTPTPAPTAPASSSVLRWGLIGNDGTHLSVERGAGITAKLLELSWSAYEPSNGGFSATYIDSKKSELAALRSAGFSVILSLGVQYAPAWLLSYPNAYYVDQYGDAYNDTCSGCEIPNFVFNATLRSLLDQYIGRVFADLGASNFAAVRLGGGHYGELGYPAKSYGSNSNTYWAYDANAQASSPVPGWKAGMASPNGEASKFLNWYLQSLTNYETWQIATARKYYAGPLMMLFPSWGIRPGQTDAAIAVNLNGTTSPEVNGEVQRGYDFARQVAAISDANVWVDSTWLDCSYGNDASTSPDDWRPVHYLAYLAAQNPQHLRTYGENTGQGSAPVMSFTDSQAKAYGLVGFAWFNEQQLFSGQYATLTNYAALIAANP